MSRNDESSERIDNRVDSPEESSDTPGNKELPSQEESEVGYGRPPKNSQFKKGVSGNPKGRPKGSCNPISVLRRLFEEKVTINEKGRRKVITKLEAAGKQQLNKAASGDRHAFQLMISLYRSIEEASTNATAQNTVSTEDYKVIEDFMKRCGNTNITGDDSDPKSE